MKSSFSCSQIAKFEPQGYLSAANAAEVEAQLINFVLSGEDSLLLVDMRGVDFIDSAGLMVLARAFRLAQHRGKRFCLCSVTPSVRMVFELTQLDKVFEIFRDSNSFEVFLQERIAA